MNVPFLDLTSQHEPIRQEMERAIAKVLDDSSFVLGPGVSGFEDAFARYTGRRFCVGVNSGTSALHLALVASGVGPGDEVITTPHTWISTTWAISYCGATPVFVDTDPATGNLDPAAVEQAVTSRTRALLPVDLYGNPADHVSLQRVAESHGITLIDDAAQAQGARLHGAVIGSFGSMACFSFYPGKNLGAMGEAGAVVTNDEDVAQRLRRLRDHAQDGRHHHTEIGFNYRMDGIQGAVLEVKLARLDLWNDQRREAAARYADLLGSIDGVGTPAPTHGAEPNWHLYAVRVPEREKVADGLKHHGVASGFHYPTPVHLQPVYRDLGYAEGSLPRAEAYAAECLSLPMFPDITPAQQEHVADSLRTVVEALQ